MCIRYVIYKYNAFTKCGFYENCSRLIQLMLPLVRYSFAESQANTLTPRHPGTPLSRFPTLTHRRSRSHAGKQAPLPTTTKNTKPETFLSIYKIFSHKLQKLIMQIMGTKTIVTIN